MQSWIPRLYSYLAYMGNNFLTWMKDRITYLVVAYDPWNLVSLTPQVWCLKCFTQHQMQRSKLWKNLTLAKIGLALTYLCVAGFGGEHVLYIVLTHLGLHHVNPNVSWLFISMTHGFVTPMEHPWSLLAHYKLWMIYIINPYN